MTRKFEGKVSIVTGAGSGIGRASTLAFAREGAKVVVADVSVAGGEDTVRMVKKAGGEAIFVKTDVTKAAEVEGLINKAVEIYGRLDYAHNNAGILGRPGVSLIDLTEEDWDIVMNINLKGIWLCMKYEIPQMLKHGGGAIVNMSSIAGLVAIPGFPVYVASKHGVIGLTRQAALEYGTANIRVNAICAGPTQTPMMDASTKADPEGETQRRATPMGRIGSPEEQASAVAWLCSDEASFVTGAFLSVDGGYVIH